MVNVTLQSHDTENQICWHYNVILWAYTVLGLYYIFISELSPYVNQTFTSYCLSQKRTDFTANLCYSAKVTDTSRTTKYHAKVHLQCWVRMRIHVVVFVIWVLSVWPHCLGVILWRYSPPVWNARSKHATSSESPPVLLDPCSKQLTKLSAVCGELEFCETWRHYIPSACYHNPLRCTL